MPKLTKPELQVMEALWNHGPCAVRDIQATFPEESRPAYTTVHTMVSRLEAKKAVRRVGKVGKAHIFEARVSRTTAHRRLIDDLLNFFGGQSQPIVARLVESGKLTVGDVREAKETLRKHARKDKSS